MLDKSTAKLASLLAVGQQLREQFDEELEPAPEHLTARLNELEAGKPQSEPAAVRLAIINAVVRASVARRTATSSHHAEWRDPRIPDVPIASRQAVTLGRFEKLMLDLFDSHLSEPERGSAVRTFVAYIRLCHAMLDLGLIKESELAL